MKGAKEELCLKGQLFSLAICFLLFTVLFSVSINSVKSAAGDGIVEVDLNVRGTFLRAMDDWPYFGPGEYQYDENLELQVGTHTDFRVEEPTIIDLQAEGFNEGDKIYISWLGGFYPDGAWKPSNPGSVGYGLLERGKISHGGLLGLFSTSSQLLDIDQLNRVPGAIEYGSKDYQTPDTWWKDGRPELSEKLRLKGIDWYDSSMKTDIPEDFRINPHHGMKLDIPRNARFLFLSLIDPYYRDNYEGPDGLIVTIEKDTDEDGIPDNWEINGIDSDKDGTIDLDLPGLGADWEHKDIFVEVDYMNTYRPNQFALDSVIDAFDNAPVTNPDMANGINLHVVVDEEIPYKEVISGFGEFSTLKSNYFGTQDERLDQKTVEAKKKVFRYCLSVDKIWFNPPSYTVPGVAEGIASDDFIVAFGALSNYLNTVKIQAALFMHELGHCLGLDHGGGDEVNYKPNYLSIMNYKFELEDYLPGRPLDYSRKELPPLNEKDLNERVGIGEAVKTVWWMVHGWDESFTDGWYTNAGAIEIDWNLDGNITSGVLMNINSYPSETIPDWTTLTGYDDWQNLVYRFRGTSLYIRSATPEDYHIELTNEQIEQRIDEAKNIIEVPTPESYMPINENVNVGVKQGDWMEYSVSYDGNPSDDRTNWFRVEIEKVEETNITAHFEFERINGEKYSFSETYDLKVGFHDTIIISSGLDLDDQFYHDQFGSINLEYIEDYGYADEERTVVAANFSNTTTHWDKTTGILTQLDWKQTPDLTVHWLIEKTSLWGQPGIDMILIVGLGFAIVIVLLIVLLFFRRKKKKSENEQKA